MNKVFPSITGVFLISLLFFTSLVEAQGEKSIRNYVSCSGTADDAAGVARAFADAKGNAFTLLVDCPVKIHTGSDIAAIVFVDNDTTVEFRGAGKFIVDNVLMPAFVLANTNNVKFINWNIEYEGGIPTSGKSSGYANGGKQMPGKDPGAAANDQRITPWLAANRGIKFQSATSIWASPTNTSAVFYLIGSTSNISVVGMTVYVPENANVEKFVPVVFSMTMGFKSNQSVTGSTPRTPETADVPHNLKFTDITFDGTYMGFQGTINNAEFQHVRSHRYGDLQDADGSNIGGVGKWFAPPHLFYLNYGTNSDPAFHNNHIQIRDVVDDGPRVGTARDKGMDKGSGNALSLKIGCTDCVVDNYRSNRPDGFMDVLPGNNMTISNVVASFDSSFLFNIYPGWRFPMEGYKNITFQNITLTDMASSTTKPPIGSATMATNENIVFKNVQVHVHKWAGSGKMDPVIAGNNGIDIKFTSDTN